MPASTDLPAQRQYNVIQHIAFETLGVAEETSHETRDAGQSRIQWLTPGPGDEGEKAADKQAAWAERPDNKAQQGETDRGQKRGTCNPPSQRSQKHKDR